MSSPHFSNAIETKKHVIALRNGEVTDWHGNLMSKKVYDLLEVGDLVRVAIEATPEAVEKAKLPESIEAAKKRAEDRGEEYFGIPKYFGGQTGPYFEIVKIKDGTFWGKATDLYSTLSFFGVLEEGDVYPFRKENIIEIPTIFMKNKKRRAEMENLVLEGKTRFF